MKIMMFAPYSYPVPGGQESHIHELMEGLKKEGIDVEIITRYKFSGSKLSTGIFYLKSFVKLFGSKADIIHAHDIHAGFVLMLYKYFGKTKSVLTVHSSIFLETYRKYHWLYRKMLGKQAAVFTTSNEIKSACEEVSSTPVEFISNGVDTEKFKPGRSDFLREKLGIGNSDKIIITTRRLDRKNNVIALAKAFDIMSKKRKDIHLVIIGDGEQRGSIQKIGNERITVMGFIDNKEIPKYLNSSDIFAIPSLYEANSISCLEAMACGLPVVGTNVGGLPDLIRSNGILCEPTCKGLVSGLVKILGCDLSAMGKKSREIAKEYSWDRLVKRYLNHYYKVLRM